MTGLGQAAGLTRILSDGTNTYSPSTGSGGRISQTSTTTDYFLGDALGSVRQLTNSTGEVTFAKSYDPYGNVTHSSGAGQSAYGYTGEQQDASGMTYLRARYYNPADGRFLTKDPSRAERNLYTYASGNPVNKIDPSGLYSTELITKNIPLSEFTHPYYPSILHNSWQERERWGFFMMLREAKDLSFFYMGSLKLNQPYPSVNYGGMNLIYSNCDEIFVDFQPLSLFYENEVKHQRQPSIFWRDTSATHYHISVSNGFKTFVDGAYDSDLPQYHGYSVAGNVLGNNLELNGIVDINGSFHLSLSGGKGYTFGVAYTESYMCNGALGNCSSSEFPSPSEVTAAINGVCVNGGVVTAGIINGGINISPLCVGYGWSLSSVATYYTGAMVGITLIGGSVTIPLPITVPSMGWKDALYERRNGVHLSDVKFFD